MNEKQRGTKGLMRRGIGRRMLSLACILTMLVPMFSVPVHAQGEQSQLSNLIFDKVYEMEAVNGYPEGVEPNDIGFAPEVTEYKATAYASVDTVQVYPFAASDTATVTVNGKKLNGSGYVEVEFPEVGTYPVEVKVSDNGESSTYTVTVEKTNADYRGRVPVVSSPDMVDKLSVETSLEGKEKLMEILTKDHMVVLPESSKSDGSYVTTTESYWSVPGSKLPDAQGTKEPVTLFTVDLGAEYSVSRIRAAFGPSNLGLGSNKARISVSTDGETWETPITKGNMNTGTQWHQNVTRYELGVSYQARYIRFEVTHWQYPNNDLRLYQFMIFVDSGDVPEKQPAPEGGGVPYQHEESHQYLSSGQATVTERGLPMLGWTPSGGYGRGTPTVEEAEQFGYDGPLFYDPDFENADYMLYNPDSVWGIAKAPFGGNNMGSAGTPRDFIPESMEDYIYNAISFCFGDEGGYSTSEAKAFGEWFAWTRQHYPGVILHSNQFPSQWSESQLREYLRIAQPDMLTWDDYYGDRTWANPSSIDLSTENVQKNAARKLINLPTWDLYRELAYGGIDGTGTKPIMFGQYLDAFAFNHSQSNKNLVVNFSLLSGMKWLNFFRVEYQFDRSYLWDEDGTPTRGLLEWGELIDRVHAVDDQLTRLNNDWIMFKIGDMGDESAASAEGFRRGNFDNPDSEAKNKEFGLSAVEMVSLSETHSGKTGDVVLGYFNTLPGLYESEIREYFADATAPKAFMVMNGLVAGTAERYNEFHIAEREEGSSDNTRQEITITTDPDFAASYTLYEVQKDNNGELREVELDENGSFTITLGGGEANLYFWNTNTTDSASSQSEGAYASFAFDGHTETYWQPEEASSTYILKNTFAASSLDQVTVVEKGQGIESITVEYQDENGDWQTYGEMQATEGIWSCAADIQTAKGIRLTITKTDGLPAIYDVYTVRTETGADASTTVEVNDNTMGTGLFRFAYDDLWSYRETESNGSAVSGDYPLEYDGHFSNWADAEATFTFYGTRVELLLRANQAANIEAAVTNSEGQQSEWKTGSGRSLVFEDLEQGVYTLTIRKKNNQQAGIDGAKVTYTGSLPENLVQENSKEADAVQVYVDQRVTDSEKENYFIYEPSFQSKEMGNDNSGFNADPDEENGWVEHVQNAQNHNLGFTRTKTDGASYTFNFYGTGVQLYAGVTPMGDANGSDNYGDLTFELDGEVVEPQKLETSSLGNNGKVSARMWAIKATDNSQNAQHKLTVTVTGGYSRIDYAVVERLWEEDAIGAFKIQIEESENGTVWPLTESTVPAGGSAVLQLEPDVGYQVERVVVNGVARTIPADGRLVLVNIQQDMTVQVTFSKADYKIQLEPGEGGVLVPSTLRAKEGDKVTVEARAFTGYILQEGSLEAVGEDGMLLELKPGKEGTFSFEMPNQPVVLRAFFESDSELEVYSVTVEEGITGGTVKVSPSQASVGDTVTITVQAKNGYEFQADSLYVVGASGEEQQVTEEEKDKTYHFEMPAESVVVSASFNSVDPDPDPDPEPSNPGSQEDPNDIGSPMPIPEADSSYPPMSSSFASDTTADLHITNGSYQFRITSKDGTVPVMTVTNSAFRVELVSQEGNDYFFRVVVVTPGKTADVLVNGGKVISVTGGNAHGGVISDTTAPFQVGESGEYQFKLTANEKPEFVAGSPSFDVEFVKNEGNDWFFRIRATGKPGDACGFYINKSPKPVTVVTIA